MDENETQEDAGLETLSGRVLILHLRAVSPIPRNSD